MRRLSKRDGKKSCQDSPLIRRTFCNWCYCLVRYTIYHELWWWWEDKKSKINSYFCSYLTYYRAYFFFSGEYSGEFYLWTVGMITMALYYETCEVFSHHLYFCILICFTVCWRLKFYCKKLDLYTKHREAKKYSYYHTWLPCIEFFIKDSYGSHWWYTCRATMTNQGASYWSLFSCSPWRRIHQAFYSWVRTLCWFILFCAR